ncbi:MAG: DUF1761 domain-containing protein [Bacteroidota bacterium]
MIHYFSAINWVSVAIAFAVYCILGGLWFTQFFKKPYAISLGKENQLPPKLAPIFIIGPAICSLVITIATALLMVALHIETYQTAMVFAGIVGIGYLFANTVNIAINPNIPKPILYGIISGMYHLVCITLVCVIIVAMH